MKTPLKESVKKFYQQRGLSEDQWNRLNALQKKQKRPLPSVQVFLALAAAVVVTFGLVYLNLPSQPLSFSKEAIVEEIVRNHNKNEAVESAFTTLADAGSYFIRLDFSLIEPRFLSDGPWELVGGRYCSIQGQTAPQLRLRHKDSGVYSTWYQFKGLPGVEHFSGVYVGSRQGVTVKLWMEQGVLQGLASPL